MKAKIEKYEYKVMFFDIKKCFLNYYFLLENHCLGLWALMPYASVLRWAPSSVTRRGGTGNDSCYGSAAVVVVVVISLSHGRSFSPSRAFVFCSLTWPRHTRHLPLFTSSFRRVLLPPLPFLCFLSSDMPGSFLPTKRPLVAWQCQQHYSSKNTRTRVPFTSERCNGRSFFYFFFHLYTYKYFFFFFLLLHVLSLFVVVHFSAALFSSTRFASRVFYFISLFFFLLLSPWCSHAHECIYNIFFYTDNYFLSSIALLFWNYFRINGNN